MNCPRCHWGKQPASTGQLTWATRCIGVSAHPIEQDHRGIKQRYYSTLGFGAFESAQRFCCADDEVRNFFRPDQRMAEFVSLSQRREDFLKRVDELQSLFQAP